MLDSSSHNLLHRVRDLAFIALSLFTFPLSTFLLWLSFVLCRYKEGRYLQRRNALRADPAFKPKTILVTGVGMTKGLALARLFYLAGHDVVGADFEPGDALVCGRVSKAIKQFYRLDPPSPPSSSNPGKDEVAGEAYIWGLLHVVTKEHVDLWVSCSGVASAVEDGLAMQTVEAETKCKVIQFNAETTKVLHEKHSFIERTRELGLNVPETKEVTSRKQVEDVFANAPKGRKYIMKTVGMDDSVRGDMTLLPKASEKDTSQHIARLKISKATPWIVQQFIDGLEFCTHSLVVDGHVKAFVACPSAELLMHYEALSPESPLSMAMLEFTKTYAENSGAGFTGHLSFDFLVERDDLVKEFSTQITLYPIECNPRAHTAVALFDGTTEMVDAYLTVIEPKSSSAKPSYADVVDPSRHVITPKYINDKYYWIGHDLTTLLLVPLLRLVLLRISVSEFIHGLDSLMDHMVFWKDGTYAVWDPFPCWWLYHVYWPLRIWGMFRKGKKWSRVNVSTGKMFEC